MGASVDVREIGMRCQNICRNNGNAEGAIQLH